MIRIVEGKEGAELASRIGERALAIVVDALRSSPTLAAMLCAGAEEIYVCGDVPTARKLAEGLDGALLAGERDSTTPEDFDLGNSPVEAVGIDLKGRSVVFTSSNGAPILVACRGAGRIVMGSPANAHLITGAAQQALATGREVIFIPAMDHGEPCEEDSAAAALLAEVTGPDINPSQETLVTQWLARIADGGLEKLFRESIHGRELDTLGFGEDLTAAAKPDIYSKLPQVLEFIDMRDGATVARVGNGS